MDRRVLNGLYPQRVFYWFEEICKIPHGSRNTKKISDFIVAFAKQHKLRYVQDDLNNVIIFKNGTGNYAEHPPVILQGHIDMVAEKTEESCIDFINDGLQICTDGEYIWAEGTTLGGDDGIAVAYALALLESEDIPHPPLECVFTVDEEIGMEGAEGLDTSILKGKTLINADSEDEGILTVSCAGGATSALTLPVKMSKTTGQGVRLTVEGLLGGHSGQEINKGRANANIVMGKLLKQLIEQVPFQLVNVCGGQKDNAIPQSSTAKLLVLAEHVEVLMHTVEVLSSKLLMSLPKTETKAKIYGKIEPCGDCAMEQTDTYKVIGLLNNVPNGVQKMSTDIKGLVQTSLNMGILKTDENQVKMTFSVRSSVNEEKLALTSKLREVGQTFGATYHQSGEYPAWEYRRESALRDIMIQTFEELYGRKPVVEAIHAGLECGLFCSKISNLDAVSFGPDMQDIHTTRERLNVRSAARTWEYLLAVLKKL